MPQHPYLWPTWLSRFQTDENSCEWAIWFKAHHAEWIRQPSDCDRTKCLMRRTVLLDLHARNGPTAAVTANRKRATV